MDEAKGVVNRIKHTALMIALFLDRDQFKGFSGSSGPFQSTTTSDCCRLSCDPASVELEEPGGVVVSWGMGSWGFINGGAVILCCCCICIAIV